MARLTAAGIVAEYDPFHQGHAYLIRQTRQTLGVDVVVSVMSGNFVQRGAPAVFPKWTRAKMAVDGGVDLVLELPVVFACSSADAFARGAVGILEGLGAVQYLAFGSEAGTVEPLQQVAYLLREEREAIDQTIRRQVRQGVSYPAAQESALQAICPDISHALLSQSNNLLAISYLRHLRTMQPFTVRRQGGSHQESASQIRQGLRAKDPDRFATMDQRYWDLVRAKVLTMPEERRELIASAGDGLGHKLLNTLRYAENLEDWKQAIKSKAYTYTRISRLMAQTLLDVTKESVNNAALYLRPLAMSPAGQAFLRQVQKEETASLPLVHRVSAAKASYPDLWDTLQKDVLATDLYQILTGENLYANCDYVHGIAMDKGPSKE